MTKLLLIVLLVFASQVAAQSPETFTGGFLRDGRWHAVIVRLNQNSSGTADFISPYYGGTDNAINTALVNLKQDAGGVHFEIPVRTGQIVFDGKRNGDSIAGSFKYDDATGTFGLTRWANVTVNDLEKFYGAYRDKSGRVISIFRGWGYARTLNFVDYDTGHVGTLWPNNENEFYAGEGLAVSYPIAVRAKFARDINGKVTGLAWRDREKPEVTARRIDLREERITYKNGDVTIGATLVLPPTIGQHPAIIITPGDYGTNRNQLRMWAHNYAANGIAALVFDSRGAGESTGQVNSSSFSQLADDVLAAVNTLKLRSDINPKQIGLFGFSNSAFTVSLAASRSSDVAFLIMQSLVGVVPWKQESYRAETQLRVDGFPAEIVKKGADFMKLKYDVARTGEGWDRLQTAMDQARGQRWLAYTNPPNSLERLRSVYSSNMIYDPVPALEKIRVPVLAMWGKEDTFLPEDESSRLFRTAMRKSGNKDYEIKLYPAANHSLLLSLDGSPSSGGTETEFISGLWKSQIGWVQTRVTVVK